MGYLIYFSIFFDACDGIFLNYGWDEAALEESISNAGNRASDIYVGIDVHGRGVFGGGGFSTSKVIIFKFLTCIVSTRKKCIAYKKLCILSKRSYCLK